MIVAWYAAVVSTLGLALSLYLALRDRARVVIDARPNYQVLGDPYPYDPNKLYVCITVANRGRRPLTVSVVGLLPRRRGDNAAIVNGSLHHGPCELAEGKSVNFLAAQDEIDLENVRAVVVRDQTGRLWKQKVRWKQSPREAAKRTTQCSTE
jgi:hypothetical protein